MQRERDQGLPSLNTPLQELRGSLYLCGVKCLLAAGRQVRLDRRERGVERDHHSGTLTRRPQPTINEGSVLFNRGAGG